MPSPRFAAAFADSVPDVSRWTANGRADDVKVEGSTVYGKVHVAGFKVSMR